MKKRTVFRTVLYVTLFVLLTGVFFVLNMPGRRLAGQVNARLQRITQGQVTVEGASLLLPFAVLLDGVTLHSPGGETRIGQVELRPSVPALLAGRLKLRCRAAGPWGEGVFSMARTGSLWEGEIGTMEVRLSGLPTLAASLSLEGQVGVTGRGSYSVDGGGVIEGQGSIIGPEIRVESSLLKAMGAGAILLSDLRLIWKAESNLLTLQEAGFAGDLIGSARGTIRLTPADPPSSRMDLNVSLRPSPEAAGRLSSAMALMGAGQRPEAGVTVRLRGTLARPSVSL